MKYFGDKLSLKHKELSAIIRKKDCFEQAMTLFREIHSGVHKGCVSSGERNEIDDFLDTLTQREFEEQASKNDETIGWTLWHIARIEDLTMSILVAGKEQVFNAEWQKKLGVSITDTGNAMSFEEIIDFSKTIDKDALLEYRNAVGKRTWEIIDTLKADDMKRKVSADGIQKIRLEGGVTSNESSAFLLDYWGGKDIAGIILMPPTRHEILHLNNCFKWKEAIHNRKG